MSDEILDTIESDESVIEQLKSARKVIEYYGSMNESQAQKHEIIDDNGVKARQWLDDNMEV